MTKGRLEAFSDGVLAIVLTIMVLELKVPQHAERLDDLVPLLPVFLSYVLSFAYVGIYWNNHHHMLQAARHVTGGVLLANLHLLFWLSLVPFVTGWMGSNHFAPCPSVLYGFVLLMAALAYWILQTTILRADGPDSLLAKAVGWDVKGKMSLLLYGLAMGLAFVATWMAWVIYVGVAVVWILPDRRIERAIHRHAKHPE